MISSARGAENERYNFEKENIRALIELCASLPKEYDFNRTELPITSQILAWRAITLEYRSYLENEELAFRFFTDIENNLVQVAVYCNSCYMIPESCQDKEKVLNYLHELLTAEYQTKACANDYQGFTTSGSGILNLFIFLAIFLNIPMGNSSQFSPFCSAAFTVLAAHLSFLVQRFFGCLQLRTFGDITQLRNKLFEL